MIDTLDIFLELDQNESDKESYQYIMEFLKEELKNKSSNIIKYIRNISLEIETTEYNQELENFMFNSRIDKG